MCCKPELLVLGSLPGDRSLALQEYYGHPQNRFWKVMAALNGEACPAGYEEKKALLARCRTALWDVYRAASRPGSMDSDIRMGEFNDIAGLLRRHPGIRTVALNGSTAAKAFDSYLKTLDADSRAAVAGLKLLRMPSTSPANARWTMEKLVAAWREALPAENNKSPEETPSGTSEVRSGIEPL